MEKRLRVKDFAEEIGTTPKTVYSLIMRNKLKTVSEIQAGRKTTFILTSDEDLDNLKKIYGKMKVNEGNCKDILTVNEENESKESQEKTVNINNSLELLINTNNQLQQQLLTYTNDLIESKSKQLLLEDKAGREGMYLNEINELKDANTELKSNNRELEYSNNQLKKDNNSKRKLITIFILVVVFLVLIIGVMAVFLVKAENKPPKVIETQKVVEKVVEKKVPVYKGRR